MVAACMARARVPAQRWKSIQMASPGLVALRRKATHVGQTEAGETHPLFPGGSVKVTLPVLETPQDRVIPNTSTFLPRTGVFQHETRNVNAQYMPDKRTPPPKPEYDNQTTNVTCAHWEERWSEERIRKAADEHVVQTWGPSKDVGKSLMIDRAEGIYVYDSDGNKYMDWTSQAVCANLGHTIPEQVRDAMVSQLDSLPMLYSGLGICEVRVRLAQLLSELCPGDINGFVFACGGGEANEAAIRIARRFTGKQKILTQYRSYHGGSTTTLAATGDFRRWYAEAGASGFVKMFNSQPFSFSWAKTDEGKTTLLLQMLEEQIRMEGPNSIAAIMLESIVGAGGALVAPAGYMEGVRALCDKYGILLILDEVMVGFGRTGKMWGFQHYPGVIPDIVTSAKGVSASFLPLSVIGMRQHIKDFFASNPLGWGATYANHPVALACGYETVKYIVQEDLPGRAAELEPLMVDRMQHIVDTHPCVRQGRAIGLMGCLDLVGPDGNMVQEYQDPNPPNVVKFREAMRKCGLLGLFRPPLLHCAPPLVITEGELVDGFERLDTALSILDW
mmetsp:Transcript_74059/g.176348  ORF Transcript_74059/g.176348 Transcript_74059/m.176348 type:complete len:560 (-) Transcript_74059:298-1977(-)|eukprot:CAMPEP_0178414970 /NCGR_PEP_ID=MMETSP0689_2-20121128/23311_1 /TAXON_ID=160604 /ORGANISM="Amphidinium massartii, Strain CS-259" /LENGTH=559 /DNA_ID=CAMNT_0020036277 /DNA_START=11 /DNA_END=1690 /DNA_ORIENTATION=-